MPKSSLSDKTTRRPKEPFDPALEDPIALTPDQLETVVGGLVGVVGQLPGVGGIATTGIGGRTLGIVAPPLKPPYIIATQFDTL
jgi:hypothetical protein